MTTTFNRKALHGFRIALLTSSLLAAAPAIAQTTTSSVSGHITNSNAAVPGATITAVSVDTGATIRVAAGPDGSYALTGLRPGPYDVSVAAVGGKAITRRVIVSIAQSETLDVDLAAPDNNADAAAGPPSPTAAQHGDIVVIGRRLVETRTSEVATNISQQQIRRLPQTDRNFLAFTQLAPGVKYNDSETDKGFQSGASTASGVNVFIDGVNLKNNVLDGGVSGQENSRGNPFAQLAIQEFRVLTQNYKAEYEQASAAIVTSVTKSGTNQFHGEAFVSYTDKHLMAANIFDLNNKVNGLPAPRPKPAFKRLEYGASLGGPIIKDKLFFFGAYEANIQDRAFAVKLGSNDPQLVSQFGKFEGNFVSPFRSKLFFGKLTFVPTSNDTVDVTASRRKETDIQGFGGTDSYEVAENKKNTVGTYLTKWTHRGENFVNEASVDYLDYKYNPTSLHPDSPNFNYLGVIQFGGKNGSQDIKQHNLTFRDEATFSNIQLAGKHVFKVGLKYSEQKYQFNKLFHVQPEYDFRGPDYSFPFQAILGTGNPRINAKNNVFGAFIQDDWDLNKHLQLNLGIRWDRESNMFNNHYVTPPAAAALLLALPSTPYFNGKDYVTDGTQRPVYNMIQPRIGFSYDINENQRSVIFGGFGRYFDRNVFNNTLDEQFRLQYRDAKFQFSTDGLPRDGNPTVIFDPKYLTREGLLALQAQGITGLPELFAVKNNSKPPRTDQFSLGFRQKFGDGWLATITGSYIKGTHGYTHLFATRNPDGSCCNNTLANAAGFADVLIGSDSLKTRYKALYLQLERPYTRQRGWGMTVAYTLQKAEQNGNDLFSLDKPTPSQYGYRNKAGIARHTLVASLLADLPLGLQFSTLGKFDTGEAFQVFDANTAPYFDVNTTRIYSLFPKKKNCLGFLARCEVDVTLSKEIQTFPGHYLTLGVDVFNLFNNKNYTGYGGFVCCGVAPSVFNFGQPGSLRTLPRRLQLRAAYRF